MKFFQRSKRNLEEQLTLYSTAATFLFVFPLSLYRFLLGDFLLGSIDLLVSIILVSVFSLTWQSKKIKFFNAIVVTAFMIAILGVVYVRSTEMIFWAYPVIAVAYFLLTARSALFMNFLFIVAVGAIASLFKGLPLVSVYPSMFLVAIFGFSFSIRSESQNKKLNRLACEDVLTKVKNRRSFDEKMEEVIANNKRFEKPVSLLLLDLDLFKKINDTYGHKQGDTVLFEFAQIVKLLIRTTDDIYRFGGEEFAVVANNTALANSGMLADTIRESVQNCPNLSKYSVTVSIGVSEIISTDDADSWFRRADLALYESKSKGRNRVYTAELDDKDSIKIERVGTKQSLKIHPSSITHEAKNDSVSECCNPYVDQNVDQIKIKSHSTSSNSFVK